MPTRRDFLHGASALAGALAARRWGAAQETAASAPQLIPGKSAELAIHTADPLVLETPLERLADHDVTPASELFVRNNSNPEGMATLEPPARPDWKIEWVGLSKPVEPTTLRALAEMPREEVEMVLQCSGNGRSMFSRAAKISGTPWGRGGIGNVRFAGVRLSDVLRRLGAKPDKSARFVTAEGFDAPPPGRDDFEHSLPLDDVLETSLLALTLNGESLPAIHGGPVRLITPGYYGTVQMKWLTRLRFEAEESASEHHAVRYRTPHRLLQPGEAFEFNLRNSAPTWRMKVATLVTSHRGGENVPPGKLAVSGYAWNDGRAPLRDVEFSIDHGASWRQASLHLAKSPYAWSRWTATLDATKGPLTLWVRAIDALGRSQPNDGQIAWNPGGYEWNGVEKLTLAVA